MQKLFLLITIFIVPALALAQTEMDKATFKLALPAHSGQLQWHAEGFKPVETSAKPNGQEIGFRGTDGSGGLMFLGFLFVVPDKASTGATCRDEAMKEEKKGHSNLIILGGSQLPGSDNLPIELVNYTYTVGGGSNWYVERGFVSTGDVCGDLAVYGRTAFRDDDPALKAIFESYRLDPHYAPQFKDLFFYAEVLYHHRMFKAAAPIFEQALAKLPDDKQQQTMRRVATDEEGMAYGISGDIAKARAVFDAAIAKDPDYPMYYYNLACADAEERKLADARVHLQQAFDRKANVVPGETLPDPAKDDSFLPFQSDKGFWNFIKGLH
jgi:hypothetical protein